MLAHKSQHRRKADVDLAEKKLEAYHIAILYALVASVNILRTSGLTSEMKVIHAINCIF